MKVNLVMLIISLLIGTLVGYGFFTANIGHENQFLIAIGSGITVCIITSGLLAISSPNGGTGNLRMASTVFLILFIISNLIFSFIFPLAFASYIVANGILFTMYIAIAYAVIKSLL